MREAAAKKKHCPLYGIAVIITAGLSHKNLAPFAEGLAQQSLCCGTACMMWRSKMSYVSAYEGWCGLAGVAGVNE